MAETRWTAIVLTGGRSSRFGGADKTAVDVADGRTSLDLILTELPSDVPVIVVGPTVGTLRPVEFCREDPPFGGPLAGVAAALPAVQTPVFVALGGDQPFVGTLATALADEFDPATTDALVPVDSHGQRQPLCAAYSAAATRVAVDELGTVVGLSMRTLLGRLRVTERSLASTDASKLVDIDTVDDLAAARRHLRDV